MAFSRLMRDRLFRFFSFVFLIFIGTSVCAQERPIGFWRAHLPFNNAQGIATDGTSLYVISDKGFFVYNPSTSDLEKYSKVEGMHETGTAAIAFDQLTGTAIIGYKNSNIDLFQNNNFKVIPDLKNKSFTGSKSINHIFAEKGFAYVSSGLGILVLDLTRQEVKETYVFSKAGQTFAVNAFTADSAYYYAASTRGLFRISKTHPTPQVFTAWQAIDTERAYSQLAIVGGNAVYATANDTVYRVSPGNLGPVFSETGITITGISGGANNLYIGKFRPSNGSGKMIHLSSANAVSDSSQVAFFKAAVETLNGTLWIADAYQGTGRREQHGGLSFFNPSGPNSPDNFGLWANGGEVWVAHGGYRDNFTRRADASGISNFKNETWTAYHAYNYPLFQDSVFDFLDIIKDPRTGTLYAGTFNSGLFEMKADGSARMLKQGELSAPGFSNFSASGMAFDDAGNLYVTHLFNDTELSVKTPAGSWYHYPIASFGRPFRLAQGVLVDDYNQKWFYSGFGGGVIVYDDGGTPDNRSDDRQLQLIATKGSGNLPSNSVRCMAKDRDGAIWIGTDAGVGIVNCAGSVFDRNCDAELRVVQFDQFAGHLFSTESVRAIAVDGANRKWIGTLNGVWLLSADAQTILQRFTSENSPLPSNTIQKIAIDGVSGEVYFGTDQGLVSYRSDAITGSPVNTTVQVFPNPVPTSYSGEIAIRGLVTDADVRITDISGQLIFRTKAKGGQATWNGLDYTGHRPQSGVYLIFVTNRDGSQTTVGKMMFMH